MGLPKETAEIFNVTSVVFFMRINKSILNYDLIKYARFCESDNLIDFLQTN